jgi:hypothetical protein
LGQYDELVQAVRERVRNHDCCGSGKRRSIKYRIVIILDGTVVEGLHAAGRFTIAAQMPCFEKEIPEIKGVHHATINLRLDRQLRVDHPDREILCVWSGPAGEVFGFLEITIEFPIGGGKVQAWIYIPNDSPHRDNRFQVEILSREINGIAYGSRCRINLPRGNSESDCIVV